MTIVVLEGKSIDLGEEGDLLLYVSMLRGSPLQFPVSISIGSLLAEDTYYFHTIVDCAQTLTGSSGSIASQNYPSDYPYNHDCIWTIDVGAGSTVRMEFFTFDLEYDSDGCDFDSLIITQGSANSQIAKLCGTSLSQKVFISTEGSVKITFKTDSNLNYSGFELIWTKI